MPSSAPLPAAPRFHYAWVVAAVTFFTLLAASGFRSTPGILIVPLEQEFGWSRATISLAVSVNLLLFGLTGPFAAALMIRYGVRAVVATALAVVAAGALLTTRMTEPWQLVLLWGVVVGLGTGCMAGVFAATVVNRWFVARRGVVLGALTAASATGQLVFLPGLAHLATTEGWRTVSVAIAVSALAAVPVVLLLMRDKPEDVGQRAFGATEADPPFAPVANPIGTAFAGLGLAVRRRDFWLLAGTFFVCGASTNGLIGTHLIPASVDHGMAETTAAGFLALIGVFDVVGTVSSGWLTDRYDSRKLLFLYYGLRGLSLLYLPAAFGLPNAALIVFVVFYGLDWVATVPPTVALSTRLFGRENGAVFYGWVFAAHQLGAASAASFAGVVRTLFGDYVVAFVGAGLLCLVAAGMALLIGRASDADSETTVLAPGARLVR